MEHMIMTDRNGDDWDWTSSDNLARRRGDGRTVTFGELVVGYGIYRDGEVEPPYLIARRPD